VREPTSRPDEGRAATPAQAPRRSRRCQRVVLGGGRGGGRDVVSLLAWHSPRLSQAARAVDLRSPADRRTFAVAGEPPADARRRLTCGQLVAPPPREL